MAETHNLLSSKGLVGHTLTSSFLFNALCFCHGLDDVQNNKYGAGAELGVARAAGTCFDVIILVQRAVVLSWLG